MKIKVKRPVIVKTVVTPKYKEDTAKKLVNEISIIEEKIFNLENQKKDLKKQIEELELSSDSVVQNSLAELQEKLQEMILFKKELLFQRDTIDDMELESSVITGILDNYVELEAGQNFYDIFEKAEIILKDGVIQEIKA